MKVWPALNEYLPLLPNIHIVKMFTESPLEFLPWTWTVTAEFTGTLNAVAEQSYSVFPPKAQIGEEIKSSEASPPNNPSASLPVPLRFSNGSTGATDKKNEELACRSAALKASSVVSNAVMNSNISLAL